MKWTHAFQIASVCVRKRPRLQFENGVLDWWFVLLFFIIIFFFSPLLFGPQKSQSLGLFYWAVSRHGTKRTGHFYPGGSGIAGELAKSKPELLKEGLGGGWARGVGLEASARSWLQRGSLPSTLVRWVQSWSRRLAAKACKAAWVNWAVHRLMRAAATEFWRRRGACRAFACARSLTKLAASSLHLPPVSMPRTMSRHRRLRMSSGYARSFLRRASVKAVPAYCSLEAKFFVSTPT